MHQKEANGKDGKARERGWKMKGMGGGGCARRKSGVLYIGVYVGVAKPLHGFNSPPRFNTVQRVQMLPAKQNDRRRATNADCSVKVFHKAKCRRRVPPNKKKNLWLTLACDRKNSRIRKGKPRRTV